MAAGNAAASAYCTRKCLRDDPGLSVLWSSIGMPTDCPAVVDTSLHTAYKQQFEQQMRAAVAASAPWMFDAVQVQQRVAEFAAGRLPSGDAIFFRCHHIRALWHSGMDVSRFAAAWQKGTQFDAFRRSPFPITAGFELVDSRQRVLACRHPVRRALQRLWPGLALPAGAGDGQ